MNRSLKKPAGAGTTTTPEPAPGQKILIIISTDRLSTGNDTLGRKLLVNFIGTLKEMGPELWGLVLVNAGVKLAVAGSEVLASLQELEKDRVMVLVCGMSQSPSAPGTEAGGRDHEHVGYRHSHAVGR